MKKLIEVFGWYGVVVIVVAYALVSFSYLEPQGIAYQILNITGALSIVIHSFYKKDYQPGVLNIVWTLIALFALVKAL